MSSDVLTQLLNIDASLFRYAVPPTAVVNFPMSRTPADELLRTHYSCGIFFDHKEIGTFAQPLVARKQSPGQFPSSGGSSIGSCFPLFTSPTA
jgi:hypothetical protein